jgi:topoisomerase IA-like protein
MSAADRAIRALPGFTYEHPERGPEVLMWEGAFGALVQHICSPDQAKGLLLEAEMIAVDKCHNRRSFSVKRPLGYTADGGKWRPNMIALSRSAFDASLARTSAQ